VGAASHSSPSPLPRFCDVSLPVPLDQAFTYKLPPTLRHRAQTGSRIVVPLGGRKLTGIIVRTHDDPPEMATRDALRLVDEQPVLDHEAIGLGRWIAAYYCAPLGEVLRAMIPLAAEIRSGVVWSLTDSGRDAARQLLFGDQTGDPLHVLLSALEHRPLTAQTLERKAPGATRLLKSLEKKGLVIGETVHGARDPLRSPAARLEVEFAGRPVDVKLRKSERELLAFLELHPGAHNLAAVEEIVPNAGDAARALARRQLVAVRAEPLALSMTPYRPPHQLNEFQAEAFARIRDSVAAKQFQTFLLYGVTGSGKTEVYLSSIEAALADGRGALLLVPEIALTPAMASQFHHRFGDRVAILHSAFSDAERAEQWRRIRAGAAPVVVGTRSGVFAPVRNLGLIIVDEEHDSSYKQQENPRYHGRDVAIVRAQHAQATIVLGSATPSLETRYNVERGKSIVLSLPERIERRPMPEVELIDMRTEFLETRRHHTFSRRLLEAIRERLELGEQTILLHNRRGFSSFVTCRACGEPLKCVNCAVTLTYHRRDKRMLCHYCNYAERVPKVCPRCESEHVQFIGTGSEKVEEELHREFPEARIARMDRDTVTGKRGFETILHAFREGNFDILAGTQMIAKGHDIPNVTLVGVISADIGLNLPDFRAGERTFQLLTQVAGRAGRGELPGRVIVQTINPDHYAIRFASRQDYLGFYEKELQFRRAMRYPPFAVMANVLVRAEAQEDALRMSGELGFLLTPPPENLRVLGPAEAPVPRLKREFRYQILLKASSRISLNATLKKLQAHAEARKWPATALVIDVDPVSLL
jgi:primosomal protein N' (replication factor Y) (superfamily II helicase)